MEVDSNGLKPLERGYVLTQHTGAASLCQCKALITKLRAQRTTTRLVWYLLTQTYRASHASRADTRPLLF